MMRWNKAVEILATRFTDNESSDYDEALEFVVFAIDDPTGKGDYEANPAGSKGGLSDWIAEGDWDGNETQSDIQLEWNELGLSSSCL